MIKNMIASGTMKIIPEVRKIVALFKKKRGWVGLILFAGAFDYLSQLSFVSVSEYFHQIHDLDFMSSGNPRSGLVLYGNYYSRHRDDDSLFSNNLNVMI